MHFHCNKKTTHVKIFAFIFFLGLPLLANAGAFEQLFAPKPVVWEVWQKHNPGSLNKIPHNKWNLFLNNNVKQGSKGINRIAYATVSEKDRMQLHEYLNAMQNINISDYNRSEQQAYWINLYNAVTVSVVLKHYPVESIRDIDISPGFFADGPWGKKLVKVEGVALTLNDIEHRILRPIWKDARIHFAVNCASLGCPNLQVEAFTAVSMNKQLESAAREYIAHPRGVRLTNDGVVVSSIFSWFQQDFGETEQDVIKYIQKYADEEMSKSLAGMRFFANDEYDWQLNDASESVH